MVRCMWGDVARISNVGDVMTTYIVKPAGAEMPTAPAVAPLVDLSAAGISDTLAYYAAQVPGDAQVSARDRERFALFDLMLPADTFRPFKIKSGSATDAEIAPLLQSFDTFNRMIGGRGIEYDAIRDDAGDKCSTLPPRPPA